ncbi:MAG: carbamoyl phosphate synthase small subunit [Clostridiales bacterium]|jgi:carbamoyl-phosphate synthase small subunit|nr:carbamoyl phosphate synthase small subunit [Clostridiales bacterium]
MKYAQVILENGVRITGNMFAYQAEVIGEIVFVTNVVGYQEVLTDPAYAGKIVVMTYPLVGNYGIILDDMEALNSRVKAVIVREKCEKPNNFRCEMEFAGFLKQNKVVGLEGVDTRQITKQIKNHGKMKAIISARDIDDKTAKQMFEGYAEPDTVGEISTKNEYTVGSGTNHVAVLDFGVTMCFLRTLINKDFKVTVFPAQTPADTILKSEIQALILSDGPGFSVSTGQAEKTVARLLGRLPVLGIGLGQNIAARACGLTVKPLKYGRNGSNHPVKGAGTSKIYITTQHESYYIDGAGEDFEVTYTNLSDGTIAGIKHKIFPLEGVSFIPDGEDIVGGTGFIYNDFKLQIEGVFIGA